MPEDEQWSVSADIAHDGATECVLLKIGCALFEANFWIPLPDMEKLKRVRETAPEDESIQIGHSAGSPAFWSRGEGDLVMIVVGDDDQTWDIGLSVPDAIFTEILVKVLSFLN